MASITQDEQDLTREDARGNTSDPRTAPASGAAPTASDRYRQWPTDRRTEEVIAERMLMAALLNYRRAMTTRSGLSEFKTHDQMSDVECRFYEHAVHTAYAAIWEGR